MTEKRFEPIADDDGFVEYIRDTQIGLLTFDEFIDTANALHEENQDNEVMIEFLSTENSQIRDELKTRTQIQHQLEEENEQLKSERDDYQNDAIKFEKECKRLANNLRLTTGDWKYEQLMHKKLEKENEQLRKEKIDAETKLYKANEELLMMNDYDFLCKENTELEKENEQLKKENKKLADALTAYFESKTKR